MLCVRLCGINNNFVFVFSGFLTFCSQPRVTKPAKHHSSSSEEEDPLADEDAMHSPLMGMKSPLPPLASPELLRSPAHAALSSEGSVSHRSGSVSHRSGSVSHRAATAASVMPYRSAYAASGDIQQRKLESDSKHESDSKYESDSKHESDGPNPSSPVLSPVSNMEDTQKSADRTRALNVAGNQSPSDGSAKESPISRRLNRVGSSHSRFTVDSQIKSQTEQTYEATYEDSDIEEQTGASIGDFVKPRFLNSNFLNEVSAKHIRTRFKGNVAKDPLIKPKSDLGELISMRNRMSAQLALASRVVGTRMKILKHKAGRFLKKSVPLKTLATKQKVLHNVDFSCRVVEERELKYLPAVVSAYPGRPRSILLVAPMNESMSSKVKDLSSELRHLTTSTICVRDMMEPIHVKDLCDMIKTFLPIALNTKGARTLTTLCLSRVFLGPDTIDHFIQSILKSAECGLRHLYCLSNNLGDAGAIQIAQCLSQVETDSRARIGVAQCLVSLCLEQNEIQDKGAAALGEAVADHPSLEHLDLRGNLITDKGAEAMSVIVCKNATLRQLNFSDNQILGAGNDAFDRALRRPDAMADKLTVVSGTQARPRLACRPKSAKPFCLQNYLEHSRRTPVLKKKKAFLEKESGKYSNKELPRQLFSDREIACGDNLLLERRKAQKTEDGRDHLIKSGLLTHATKTQDSHNAIRFITEMGKNMKKLQDTMENIEKVRLASCQDLCVQLNVYFVANLVYSFQEKKAGWKQQKERIQGELEWITRDLARRQKYVKEVRKQPSCNTFTHRSLLAEKLMKTSVCYSNCISLIPRLARKCAKTLCTCFTSTTW
jgi:hypothetical protein